MKTSKTFLPLAAALLAMPAMSQEAEVPQKTTHYSMDATDSDLAFAMVAKSRTTQKFHGQCVLVDGTLCQLQKSPAGDWVLEIPAGDLHPSDLYIQGVTYDAEKGLTIHPIERFPGEAPNVGDAPADKTPAGETPASDAPASDLDERAANKPVAAPKDPIELKLVARAAGSPDLRLLAQFTARSSDYGLDLVRVMQRDDMSHAEVYLYRKQPGEGEGLQDLLEQHSVTVDLSGVEVVQVFLAEGTERKVRKDADWQLLAQLSR